MLPTVQYTVTRIDIYIYISYQRSWPLCELYMSALLASQLINRSICYNWSLDNTKGQLIVLSYSMTLYMLFSSRTIYHSWLERK